MCLFAILLLYIDLLFIRSCSLWPCSLIWVRLSPLLSCLDIAYIYTLSMDNKNIIDTIFARCGILLPKQIVCSIIIVWMNRASLHQIILITTAYRQYPFTLLLKRAMWICSIDWFMSSIIWSIHDSRPRPLSLWRMLLILIIFLIFISTSIRSIFQRTNPSTTIIICWCILITLSLDLWIVSCCPLVFIFICKISIPFHLCYH